jgi:hypothetical protein
MVHFPSSRTREGNDVSAIANAGVHWVKHATAAGHYCIAAIASIPRKTFAVFESSFSNSRDS